MPVGMLNLSRGHGNLLLLFWVHLRFYVGMLNLSRGHGNKNEPNPTIGNFRWNA